MNATAICIGIFTVLLFISLVLIIWSVSKNIKSVHKDFSDDEIEAVPTKAVMLGNINKLTEIIDSEIKKDTKGKGSV